MPNQALIGAFFSSRQAISRRDRRAAITGAAAGSAVISDATDADW